MKTQISSYATNLSQNNLIKALKEDNLEEVTRLLAEKKDVLQLGKMQTNSQENFLHLALKAKKHHTKFLQLLIEYGILAEDGTSLLDKSDLSLRSTPLELALNNGYNDCVEILVKNNAPVEAILYDAMKKGSLERIKLLIDNGALRYAATQGMVSPLHLAVEYKSLECINLLIDSGADINAISKLCDNSPYLIWSKKTYSQSNLAPLHMAILMGWVEGVRFLIQKGAAVNVLAHKKMTALHFAVQCKNVKCIELLIEADADINAANEEGLVPLQVAIQVDWAEGVALLLDKGALVNAVDNGGFSFLRTAIEHKNLKYTELLIEKGASIHATDESGLTPLQVAIQVDWVEGVALLLDKGALMDAVDKNGASALHIAVVCQHFDCMERLIREGSWINAVDKFGWTPLHIAIKNNWLEGIIYLIIKGADMSHTPGTPGAALHLALKWGVKKTCIVALIRHGASIEARDEEGYTPLQVAAQTGDAAVIKILGKDHVAVDATTLEKQETALHLAAEKGDVKCVKSLLLLGADPLRKNKDGFSPRCLAAQNGHTECVTLLEQHILKEKERNGVNVAHISASSCAMSFFSEEEQTCSEESDFNSEYMAPTKKRKLG